MSCNTYNFNITQGCSFLVYLNAQNSDGTYINLSGYNARGFVKNQYSDLYYVYNLNPIPIQPMVSGLILISGDSISTQYLPPGSFSYDIEIYNNNGYSLQILNGDFNVAPSTSYYNYATGQTGISNPYGYLPSGSIMSFGSI